MLDTVAYLSLSMHCLLINVNFPALIDAFTGAVFPIIAFDYFPTEWIYESQPMFTY
jgi:hypothetical protein